MNSLKWVIPILIVAILVGAGAWAIYKAQIAKEEISPIESPNINFPGAKEASPTPQLQVQSTTPPVNQPATGQENGLEITNIGIRIISPQPNVKITSPVKVTGMANVTSQRVVIQIKDANGDILGQGHATACLDLDACAFQASILFSNSQTTTGQIEAYSPSTIDNSATYLQSIPVTF